MEDSNEISSFCSGYIEKQEFGECGNDPREGDLVVDFSEQEVGAAHGCSRQP